MLRQAFHSAAVSLLAVAALVASDAHAPKIIKQAAESDLVSVDPVWTSAHITAGHAYLIYDNLFAQDSNSMTARRSPRGT
jgi:peptide/nickel transport system substrate-binding protein